MRNGRGRTREAGRRDATDLDDAVPCTGDVCGSGLGVGSGRDGCSVTLPARLDDDIDQRTTPTVDGRCVIT